MAPLIQVPFDAFKEVEKMLHFRFWDKGRERSNRAAALAEAAKGTTRRCPLGHPELAYSGPPNDPIRAYVCLRCNAVACEPEIKDRGFEFDTIVVEEIYKILDLDLERQSVLGNKTFFGGFNGQRGA